MIANQRPMNYDERYKFTGKERDAETGYDYFGARYYVSPLYHWTKVDPLAEQTPWQSPYSYAGNRFINAIDWLGLGGLMSGYHYTEINNDGFVILHIDNGDNSVVYNGEVIGLELEDEDYIVGFRA